MIVDDHPVIRESLGALVHRELGLEVCGEADNARDALRVAKETQPDLVILDLSLNGSHGLDCLEALLARRPAPLVIVVSVHDETLHAERVLRAGARGYVEKREPTATVLHAIRTVAGGGIFASPRVASRLAETVAGRGRSTGGFWVDILTQREIRVFELLGCGRSTRQIAAEMGIRMSTVETYRARIKAKLGLRDSFELIQHAIRWAEGEASVRGAAVPLRGGAIATAPPLQ